VTSVQGVDPRTGRPIGDPIPVTTAAELDGLLAAADSAAEQLTVSEPRRRAELLRALADALDGAAAHLVPLAMAESGLPEGRLVGEVARTSGQLRMFAEVALDGAYLEITLDRADPAAVPPRPDLRRWREPLGPVLVFAASNFPFAFSVLGGDTASALAAGCPVLVKAHGAHPATSVAVADLARRVVAEQGLPAGVFGLVVGDDAGLAALRDPRIAAAGFTGSTSGGRFLADVAAHRPRPIPFFGELGSINPVVVTPAAVKARGDAIAQQFVASMTLGTGQFCTKPGLLFLPADHDLSDALVAAAAEVAAAPLLNARIRDQLHAGLDQLANHPDVRPLTDARTGPEGGAWAAPQIFVTSATALRSDPKPLAEEYFGPNAVVVEYADEADLLAALNVIDGSLTATVHLEDSDIASGGALVDCMRRRAGRVIVNGWPTGVAVAWSMHHGGPPPATTDPAYTSVGAAAIHRWVRPICYQDVPEQLLPEPLRDDNPWRVPRRIDGKLQLA
jgi:NADP-dependent aldehyde dehydrogenase